jgi:hypothetical protein
MTPKPRNFAQLLFVAGAAVSVAVAPIAAADPTGVPEAGMRMPSPVRVLGSLTTVASRANARNGAGGILFTGMTSPRWASLSV